MPRPLDALFPLIALILLWPMVAKYERPIQDRDFASYDGGSTDFICNYLGSLAFIRGFDPYLNGRPEFRDPWRREIVMDGVPVSQYYLPGHYVALAPLAWIYGDDWETASRAYFRLHLLLIVVLAWVVAWGARRAVGSREPRDSGGVWRLWAATLVLFGLHVGVRVGLERGQSDVIQALLLWGGVVLAAQSQMALAGFLVVAGTSLKGYGAILALGLALSWVGRREFRALLLGGLAAGLPLLALTWPFVLTSLRVALHKSGDFSYHWTVHGFKHIGWAIAPGFADPFRYVVSLASFAVAAMCWLRYRDARDVDSLEKKARLVVAATASVAAMVGFSSSSHTYNLILVLPGLVFLADLMREQRTTLSGHWEALFASAFLMIVLRTPFRHFAPASYGLVLLVLWCASNARSRDKGSLVALAPGRSQER